MPKPMCNLSQGVKAEGINIGEMRMLVKQVRKGRVTIEEAAEDAGMTVEEFKKGMENTSLQAVYEKTYDLDKKSIDRRIDALEKSRPLAESIARSHVNLPT